MFEWKEQYSVRITSIDGQHQNLFRLAEELYVAMSAGQGKAALSRTLDRLVQYTSVHFSHEERLMRDCGYPGIAEHRKQHQLLSEKVLALQADFESGRACLTVDLLHFLRDWLQNHIANSDQRYAPYVKKREAVTL